MEKVEDFWGIVRGRPGILGEKTKKLTLFTIPLLIAVEDWNGS